MEDTEARLRLSALEEQAIEQARALASLRSELSRLSEAQESAGVAAAAGLERLSQVEAEVAQMRPWVAVAQAQSGEFWSAKAVQTVLRPPGPAQTAATAPAAAPLAWSLPPTPALGQFSSVIVPDFPDMFAEFRGKRFSLL
jgi:hypothetical protein